MRCVQDCFPLNKKQKIDNDGLIFSIDSFVLNEDSALSDVEVQALPRELEELKWIRMFDALVQYGEEHDGNCNVPQKYSINLPDGTCLRLGNWLHNQRQFKKGVGVGLREDHENRLQDLVDQGKLLWSFLNVEQLTSDDIKWEAMYKTVVQYGQNNDGNCNVPKSFSCVMSDGSDKVVKLGAWLSKQRQHKKGKGGTLRADREARLQELVDLGSFVWEMDASTCGNTDNFKWDSMYEALVKAGEAKGTCNFPRAFKMTLPDGSELKIGEWLCGQRQLRKGKRKQSLRPDRQARLQELVDRGLLTWVMLDEATGQFDDSKWDAMFEAVLLYGREHDGNCNIPVKYVTKLQNGLDVKLGAWLSCQRQLKRGTADLKLRPDREARLQGLVNEGMLAWDFHSESMMVEEEVEESVLVVSPEIVADDERWDAMFDSLLVYGSSHGGDHNVPSMCFLGPDTDGSEYLLSVWLGRQRLLKQGKGDTLRPDRTARLQALVDNGSLSWAMCYVGGLC